MAVGGGQQVARCVVGEGIGRGAVTGPGELAEGIIGIGPGLAAGGFPGDIARGVVGTLAGEPVCPAEADGILGNTGGGAGCSGGVGVGSARFAVDARQAAQSVVEVLDFPVVTLESVLSEACRFLPQQPDLMLMFSESQSHHDASRT